MKISDEFMKRLVALPAAAATALTASLDLKTGVVGPIGSNLELHLTVDAVPALVADKSITVDVMHCATEGGSYEVVPTTGNMVVKGGVGNGAAKKVFRLYLPPDTLRFLKFRAAVETGGGSNIASNLTAEFKV